MYIHGPALYIWYMYIHIYACTYAYHFVFLNGMDDWHHNSPICRFFQQVGYPKWMVVFALFFFFPSFFETLIYDVSSPTTVENQVLISHFVSQNPRLFLDSIREARTADTTHHSPVLWTLSCPTTAGVDEGTELGFSTHCSHLTGVKNDCKS